MGIKGAGIRRVIEILWNLLGTAGWLLLTVVDKAMFTSGIGSSSLSRRH